MDGPGAVDHMGRQPLAIGHVLGDHGIEVEGLEAVELLQDFILLSQRTSKPIPKPGFIQDVEDPDAVALRFIGIGGANAPTGGADAAIAAALFHRLVEQAVVGHGHVGRAGQLQAADIDAVALEHLELAKHHLGIDDRA